MAGLSQSGPRQLPGSIPLFTRTGREIPNLQDLDVRREKAELCVRRYRERYQAAEIRRWPTGQYNCHGMTFASRRTGIWADAPRLVRLILEDDGYRRIGPTEVREGDLVVYHEGDTIEHTGVILAVETDDRLIGGQALRVMSKWSWGGEYVHYVKDCPYAGPGWSVTYWSDRHADGDR